MAYLFLICCVAWSPKSLPAAEPITYTFTPRSAGGWTVKGCFTTDGTIGLLTTANILFSSVLITDGTTTFNLGKPTEGALCHFDNWAFATATSVTIPLVGPGPAMDWCRDQTGTGPGIRISAGGTDPETIYFFAGGAPLASGTGAVMPFATASPFCGFEAADSSFQLRYVANLNVADSLINITNTGMNGAMPFGPGIGPQAGNICVNVYAFSPDEQMVGCCSCHVTPNGLASLSVYNDIRAITLTDLTPNSMIIKLVASATGMDPSYSGGASACSQSAAGLNVTHPVAPGGLSAWATTGHVPGAFPIPGAPAPLAITETKFTPATLSEAEITSLNNRCTAIIGNGSTFGTCRSCTLGGRGPAKL